MADESVQTTLEEASRCYRCNQPGRLVGKSAVATRAPDGSRRDIPAGTQLHQFECVNERCRNYGTVVRIVQVNPDGSIPPATTRRDKQFPAVPDLSLQINQQLAAQLARETDPEANHEIRR